MSIDPVNIGSTPNDGSGHDLRSGGAIINANFAQLDARTAAAQAKADAAVPGSELGARVRSTTLAGLGSLVNAAIVATDTVLQAFAKLQAQINQSIKKGEFGLGGDTGADAADCNLITRGGYYKVTAETLNQPGQGGCSLAHVSHSPGFWTQLAFGQGAGAAMWLRSQSGAAPGPWGRVLKTGDYGIGTKDTALVPGNTLSTNPETGIYGWAADTAGAPSNTEGGIAIHGSRAAAWGCKLIMSINSDKLWFKRWSAGVDQPPVRLVLQGDYGIGTNSPPKITDLNKALTQGVYSCDRGATGAPRADVFGSLEVSPHSATSGSQVFTATQGHPFGEKKWYRSYTNTPTTFSPWMEILKAGDFGLGAATTPYSGTATPPVAGFSRFEPGSLARPFDHYGTLVDVTYDVPTGSWNQIGMTLDASYFGFRGSINGTVFPWRRLDTQYVENVNGRAVLLADGTMICWTVRKRSSNTSIQQGSLWLDLGTWFSWAIPFVGDRPAVSFSTDNPAGSACWCISNTVASLTGVLDVRTVSVISGAAADISCVAIGRWK